MYTRTHTAHTHREKESDDALRYTYTYACLLTCTHTHVHMHNCQPLLGVNLSLEFVNLYFPYAGWGLLFFHWYQRHFEFQMAHVAVEGRSNVVLNMHAQLQISLLMRFLSILHKASQCAFGNGFHWLLV